VFVRGGGEHSEEGGKTEDLFKHSADVWREGGINQVIRLGNKLCGRLFVASTECSLCAPRSKGRNHAKQKVLRDSPNHLEMAASGMSIRKRKEGIPTFYAIDYDHKSIKKPKKEKKEKKLKGRNERVSRAIPPERKDFRMTFLDKGIRSSIREKKRKSSKKRHKREKQKEKREIRMLGKG